MGFTSSVILLRSARLCGEGGFTDELHGGAETFNMLEKQGAPLIFFLPITQSVRY